MKLILLFAVSIFARREGSGGSGVSGRDNGQKRWERQEKGTRNRSMNKRRNKLRSFGIAGEPVIEDKLINTIAVLELEWSLVFYMKSNGPQKGRVIQCIVNF